MYSIGVDLGGTNISAGLTDENGRILYKKSVPTKRERNHYEIIKDMAGLCVSLAEEYGINIDDVETVGIGSPGMTDSQNAVLLYSNNLNFRNVDLRNEMRKYLSLPVFLDNDANCAAFGESICGAAAGYKNSVTITLGTGIGGGIIINNKIYSGSFFGGGEIGHIVVKSGGEKCSCGRHGCWEAYASATALIRSSKIAAEKNKDSLLFKAVDGNLELIDAKLPFDMAKKGDETSKAVIEEYIAYLAEGLTNIINIFQPEVVAVGGGICAQGDYLLKPLIKLVERDVYGGVLKTKILRAALGNDAGIVGAAMLGIK